MTNLETSLQTFPFTKESTPCYIYENIGFLKAIWVNHKGATIAINLGSAFLLSPRILMTCSHNIFNSFIARNADIMQFTASKLQSNCSTPGYRSKKKLQIKKGQTTKSFSFQVEKEQLCLILLERDYNAYAEGLKIGELKEKVLLSSNVLNFNQGGKSQLKIIGYPLTQKINIRNQMRPIARKQIQGSLEGVEQYKIYHSIPTKSGFSGSPILCKNDSGQYYVVGIHTHRGADNQPNQGIYFNHQMICRTQSYVQDLNDSQGLAEQVKVEENIIDDDDCSSLMDQSIYQGLVVSQ